MKKNLVKLMACVLATVSLGSLASCGEQQVQAVDTVEINVWATAAEEAVITKVVSEWNAEHEAAQQFKVKFTAVAEGDCGTTLSKDPTVDGAPALFLCADDHIFSLRNQNIIAEIKGDRKQRIIDNNTETSVLGVTQENAIWGYPVTADNGYFMWYDKSQVKAKTVGNLEELLAHAKSLKKSVLMDVPNGWYANSFIMSPQACGTDSLKWRNEGGKAVYDTTWDSEVGVKVSEYIQKLLTSYYADGTLKIGSNDAIQQGFSDGSLIAAVSGTWMEPLLLEEIGDNLAADKLPEYHIDGQAYQMASFVGSKVYCINKTRPVEEQKTAATLAELLTTKESQLIRFEERASLPCNNDALKDRRYTKKTTIGGAALVKQTQYGCIQAQTAEGKYWDIGKAIGQAYIDGQLGEETWAQFLKGQMDTLRKAG